MEIKVIMDSGREYVNEIDDSVEEFLKRAVRTNTSETFISLDQANKNIISVSHISSVELD